MLGETISHYKILEKLGEGGMGVVYRARDTKLDRDVAIKFLPAGMTGDEDAGRRFRREARAAAFTAHKLLIMSHSRKALTELGRLVAAGKQHGPKELYERYFAVLMDGMRLIATVKKNTDVLFHAMGYFKRDLDPDEKAELREVIERYHDGFVPLVVPLTLLGHYVRKYRPKYLLGQVYLEPHPAELMLRNHA